MARNNARLGRLRRVLNEDQSTVGVAYDSQASDRVPGDTPRYGAGANIENHPQITDYIPRRMRMLGLMLSAGAVLGVLAEVVAHHANFLSGFFASGTDIDLAEVFSTRLIAWTSASVLLVASAYAHIIYLLKRHRIDDLKGRYRVWRTASLFAVLLSANCFGAFHNLFASLLSNSTGWQFLQNDTGWWLLPSLLVGGYVLAKLIIDAAECRAALTAFLLAFACFTVAALGTIGWSPTTNSLWLGTITRTLPLAGYLLSLMGCLLTARFVVLDVQGLIEHDAPEISNVRKVFNSNHTTAKEPEVSVEEEESESAWIDGSHPEDDYDRPLSKAERKRLRKQQRHRAA